MLKLIGRFILLAAGAVDLAAVMAGRAASERGLDVLRILRIEIAGASVGLLLAFFLVSLGRGRRRPGYRAFSDGACVVLAVVWLALMGSDFLGHTPKIAWQFAELVWAVVAVLTVVTWFAALTSGADDPSRTGRPGPRPARRPPPTRPEEPPRPPREQGGRRQDRTAASTQSRRQFEWPSQE